MQGRIKRSGLDLKHVGRTGADRLADAVSMMRPPAERLQNEHGEGSLQEFDPVRAWFTHGCRHSTPMAVGCLHAQPESAARPPGASRSADVKCSGCGPGPW